MPPLLLEDLNLPSAERRLCATALETTGNIVGAAQLLGITHHALKRRMIKLDIARPRGFVGDTPRAEPPAIAAS